MSDSGLLKLPFNSSSIKSLISNNEHGDGGYYPFGSFQFWHAGIHIHTEYDNKSLVDAILPGEVVAYRICEKYERVPLPKALFDECHIAEYKKHLDLYEAKVETFTKIVSKNGAKDEFEQRKVTETHYYLKKDLPEEKQKIEYANGFILLKHEYRIKELEKPFIFYSFYMNLAAKEELNDEDKNIYEKFICDGASHYLKEKERFEISKIGIAGLNIEERYLEFAIIQKDSLFNYKINKKLASSEIRKIFYSAENITDFYTRKNSEVQSKKTVIPKGSVLCVQDEISSGGKTAKKVCFKKIGVYLPSSAMDKPKKGDKKALLINVESATAFSKAYTNENFPAIEDVRNATKAKLTKGAEFTVIDMAGTQPLILLDFDETKSFWILDGTKNIFLPEIGKQYELKESAITGIPVYDECPIYSEFTKNEDNSIKKNQINGFSNLVYLDKNNTQYVEILNKKNLFVKVEDSEKCNICPFEWEKYFNDETKMQGGLFCDRTHLFTKYDKSGLLKDLYMANAEHDFITEDELHIVYGNKGDFSGASELRKEIRKVVCKHTIEFDESLFDNIYNESKKHKDWGCHTMTKESFGDSLKITDVWKNGLQKEFKKNELYFIHPLYFLNHLVISGVISINPYKGLTYEKVHGGSIGKNVDSLKLIKDNPGFAPVWCETGVAPNPNTNGFAAITGFFNEDFANGELYTDYDNYYHEGVDFRGKVGTDIISFISGRVMAYGYFGNYGRAIFVDDFGSDGIFLLGHLSEFNITVLDTGLVKPGDIVGKVGTSGRWHSAGLYEGKNYATEGYDNRYNAHLHVTYFANVDKKQNFIYQDGNFIKKYSETDYEISIFNKIKNPLSHDSEGKKKNKKKAKI